MRLTGVKCFQFLVFQAPREHARACVCVSRFAIFLFVPLFHSKSILALKSFCYTNQNAFRLFFSAWQSHHQPLFILVRNHNIYGDTHTQAPGTSTATHHSSLRGWIRSLLSRGWCELLPHCTELPPNSSAQHLRSPVLAADFRFVLLRTSFRELLPRTRS